MRKIKSRSALRRLSQWASLSALATSGVSATAMGAVIYHHGPGLTFPIALPGGNKIRTQRSFDSREGSLTNGGPSFFSRRSGATLRETAFVSGVQFGAVPANKGQTFNQVGPGTGFLVAHHQKIVSGIFREFHLSPYIKLSTLKALKTQFFPFAGESGNPYLVSLYRHATYLRSSVDGKTTGLVESAHLWLEVPTPPGFSDEYELFRFPVGSHFDYGWLELSLYNFGPAPDFIPIAYAYNTSGKPIPAGYTGIPEPAQLPVALSALSLGAIGLREWRKSRRKHTAA